MTLSELDVFKKQHEHTFTREQRIRCDALILLHNYNPSVVARSKGVHLRTVQDWLSRAQTEGHETVILGKKRSLPPQSYRALSTEQQLEIQAILLEHLPSTHQAKIKSPLWNVDSIRELVKHLYAIELSTRTICTYLNLWKPGWGFDEMKSLVLDAQQSAFRNNEELLAAKKRGEIFSILELHRDPPTEEGHSGTKRIFCAIGNREKLHFLADIPQPEDKTSGWNLFLMKMLSLSRKKAPGSHPYFLFVDIELNLDDDEHFKRWFLYMQTQCTIFQYHKPKPATGRLRRGKF